MSDPFFDTSIIVDWLLDRRQAVAELSRYQRHRISRIVWTEVLAAEPMETRNQVLQLLAPFEVVELDGRIAAAAADMRHRMKIKLQDALVLATAQVNGAILVTRNSKDFPATMPGVRIPYKL